MALRLLSQTVHTVSSAHTFPCQTKTQALTVPLCLFGQTFLTFHSWGKTMFQPPSPTFINCFIMIRMRPSRLGTWKTWQPLSAANTDVSAPWRSSCELCTFTRMRPWDSIPRMFQDFTSRGFRALCKRILTSKLEVAFSFPRYVRTLAQRAPTLDDTHLWVFKPPSFAFCHPRAKSKGKTSPLEEYVITLGSMGDRFLPTRL
jgi:hypothetical protein